MNDIMLDLETMGRGPEAAIVSIGAVAMDLDAGQLGSTFYKTIDLASAQALGGQIDADTVIWWLNNPGQGRADLTEGTNPIIHVLADFRDWLTDQAPIADRRVWGNGAAFDNVILASAYRHLGIGAPWYYWNDRCYRTVKNLHPEIKPTRTGTAHNALDDAITQANHLLAILATRRAAA